MDIDRLATIAESVDPLVWIILGSIVLAILLAGILVGWAVARARRRRHYRQRFGPEYDRIRAESGSTAAAEAELERREQRVNQLEIRPLDPDERDGFAAEWRRIESRFVDDPQGSVRDADRLLAEVMNARGYPVGDFDQRVEDLSVEHPEAVDSYRRAHEVAERNDQGTADTEELRQSLVDYRVLFDDLLVATEPEPSEERRPLEAT